MKTSLVAEATILVKASAAHVWHALTAPEIIKKYFFGADVITDWKVGSPIVYRGVWEGRAFEDKGMVLQVEVGRLLVVTHWSPLSGMADVAENYHTVSYELSALDSGIQVTITQDNNATEDERKHSEQNWQMVLQGLKKLLEG